MNKFIRKNMPNILGILKIMNTYQVFQFLIPELESPPLILPYCLMSILDLLYVDLGIDTHIFPISRIH